MNRLTSFISSFNRLKTVDDAVYMGLKHCRNVYGDNINIYNFNFYI